jgi:hypothetical protein
MRYKIISRETIKTTDTGWGHWIDTTVCSMRDRFATIAICRRLPFAAHIVDTLEGVEIFDNRQARGYNYIPRKRWFSTLADLMTL